MEFISNKIIEFKPNKMRSTNDYKYVLGEILMYSTDNGIKIKNHYKT
jgi:hypothetical protein